ncbi:MAG: GNAT family N-acetyltransferase [Aureispira sp.]
MEIKTLQGIATEELLTVFNAAFAQYFIPIQLTLQQFSFKLKVDHVVLEFSVGAFEQGRLVGFILHGLAPHQGQLTVYNAGTGVLEVFRGQQLTKKMYQYILPILRTTGVDYSILEVIKENIPAQKVYEQVGFKRLRLLDCYQQNAPIPDTAPNRVQQRTGDHCWLLPQYIQDKTPTWQNSFHAINCYQDSIIQFLVEEQGALIASLIVYKTTGRILQLYVEPAHRRKGIGRLLIGRAAAFFPGLSMINVEHARMDFKAFLEKLGFECTLQQYEMGLIL